MPYTSIMYHIVTPFPELLTFSFYAPMVLRIALGLYALAFVFSHREQKKETYRGLFLIVGISLLIGFYVQISAVIIALLFIISVFDSRARLTADINKIELGLLLVISLTLLITGAGPWAIDLPL